MVIQPVSSVIIPNFLTGGVSVLFWFNVKPNQSYTLEVTNNGLTYTKALDFTTGSGQSVFSHTVNDPAVGPWPRLSQN